MKFILFSAQILTFCAFMTLSTSGVYSQTGKSSVSDKDREKALELFIEGKTLELKQDYVGAMQAYRSALRYDKSAGIYHALSDVYFKLYKFEEAKEEILKALKLAPDNVDYLENLANSYIALKDFVKAAATFEKILSIDSEYTYGLYSLARLYEQMNLPAQALVVYERITDKIGFDFDVLNKMYDIYISNKNYTKAAEVLESILQIDPYNTELKRILGSLYMQTGQYAEARRVYESVFAINPEDKTVQSELVKIYFLQNESEKAFDNFRNVLGKDSLEFSEKVDVGEIYLNMASFDSVSLAVAKDIFETLNRQYPDEWLPYYYLGTIKFIENDAKAADEYIKSAIERADTAREVYVSAGLSYYQNGESSVAIEILDEGILKYPDDYRMYYLKALSLQSLGDLNTAIANYETAVEIYPSDINILSALALAYDTQGLYSKSESTYEMALKIDPTNALLLNNYAYNLSERDKDLDKALTMAKIAVEKEPANSSYLDTIGWVYFKLKNYKAAKEYIEKSLQANPNSAVVLEHLGDVYDAMKDRNNAVRFWKQALQRDPGNENLKKKIEFYSIS